MSLADITIDEQDLAGPAREVASIQEAEHLAYEDFEKIAGKLVELSQVYTIEDISQEIDLDPPVAFQIGPYQESQDLFYWSDGEFLDPRLVVIPLEKDPRVPVHAGFHGRTYFVYGRSYQVMNP